MLVLRLCSQSVFSRPKVTLSVINRHRRATSLCYNRMSTKGDGVLLQHVVKRLGVFASTKLSESWDNVGLLVEPSGCHKVKRILLTNDLTQAVMEESIKNSVDLIISYHPPIFVPFKRLCQGNWKERIIIQSVENRIAIYSPHTCYDAVKGGVNDWLLSCFGNGTRQPILQSFDLEISAQRPNGCYKICFAFGQMCDALDCLKEKLRACKGTVKVDQLQNDIWVSLEVYVIPSEKCLANVYSLVQQSKLNALRSDIIKMDKLPLLDHGMGRILHLDESITIEDAIKKVKELLEIPKVRLALARKATLQKKISVIAVCAGSGGSVLKGVDAELYITGEMSHHEVLHAAESGRSVILCDHSNSERGFLKTLMPIMEEWFHGEISVSTSQEDRDPLTVV